MSDAKRTGAEIREYCEAATEGPWGKNERHYGDIYSPVSGDLGRMYHANNHDFVVNARTDMPRLLDAAMSLRRMYKSLWELVEIQGESAVLTTTAWLAGPEEEEPPNG